MAQTMADYLFEQGEKRGEKRARREVLLNLLKLKFDSVPEPISKKISAMRSLSRLDTLIERAATAQTLDEIDWDNT